MAWTLLKKVKLNTKRNHKVRSVFQKTICRILSDWFSNCHGLFPIDRLRLWRQNSNVVQYLDGTCHFYCPFQSMEGLFFHYFYPKSRGRIRFSIVVKLKYFFHKKRVLMAIRDQFYTCPSHFSHEFYFLSST